MAGVQSFLKKSGSGIVAVLFVVSIVMAIGQDVEFRFADPQLLKASRGYVELDQDMVDLVKGKGLFLYFVDFPTSQQWLIPEYYSRFTDVLYPAPVLATDPGTTVFTTEQLLNGNFDPSAQWLIDHGTYFEVTYTWHTDTNSCDWSLVQVSPPPTGDAK
jgi:hypothetical protein